MSSLGRGRGVNLPAWMTQGDLAVDGGNGLGSTPKVEAEGYTSLPPPPFAMPPPNRDRSRSRSREREPVEVPGMTRIRTTDGQGKKGGDSYTWSSRKDQGRSSNFDLAPQPGMEPPDIALSQSVAGGSAGRSGHSVVPGAPSVVVGGNGHGHIKGGGGGGRSSTVLDRSQETRHARRLLIGNLPRDSNEREVITYLNDLINKVTPTDCPYHHGGSALVISMRIQPGKNFGFVELGNVEMTTAIIQLDGVEFHSSTGITTNLRIKRPNDYRPEMIRPGATPTLNTHLVSRVDPDAVVMLSGGGASQHSSGPYGAGGGGGGGPDKLFIGGIPTNLSDADFVQLLLAFGPVKTFKLVRDPGAITSKGFGFVQYFDEAISLLAMQGLNGIEIGNKVLTVKPAGADKAPVASTYPTQGGYNAYPPPYGGGGYQQAPPAVAPGMYAPHGTQYAMPPQQYTYAQQQQQQPPCGGYGAPPAAASYNAYPPAAALPPQPHIAYGGKSAVEPSPYATAGAPASASAKAPTSVLKLSNMVLPEELRDDQEWADITEDVEMECNTHGRVSKVVVPRTKEGYPQSSEGFIYVEFKDVAGAVAADKALQGKKFAKRIVISEYYDENLFRKGLL